MIEDIVIVQKKANTLFSLYLHVSLVVQSHSPAACRGYGENHVKVAIMVQMVHDFDVNSVIFLS